MPRQREVPSIQDRAISKVQSRNGVNPAQASPEIKEQVISTAKSRMNTPNLTEQVVNKVSSKYKGKTPARTVSGESDIKRPPFPVGGKPGKGGGFGPGGRFGRGGWQASGQRMKKNFLAKTAEQEEESKRKRLMLEAKRRAAKTRMSATKKGPNEKQSQLLGGE